MVFLFLPPAGGGAKRTTNKQKQTRWRQNSNHQQHQAPQAKKQTSHFPCAKSTVNPPSSPIRTFPLATSRR
jgi:hypothetical protein